MSKEELANKMRANPTKLESRANGLMKKTLSGRYERQVIIGPYIVDFLFPKENTIIEVDGKVHDDRIVKDNKRDEYLRGLGYKVFRFPGRVVFSDTGNFLWGIRHALANHRIKPPKDAQECYGFTRIAIGRESPPMTISRVSE